ncbi:MAG: DNA alkylation repair protein [Clostridia bacterium]|nr:DNA alkylation repair protein [Clostridia bacterium]
MISRINKELFNMQDLAYRDFHSRLVPTLDKNTIIGVRTPLLRKFAKQLAKEGSVEEFLSALPHKYYEENNLHAFIIEDIKDFKTCISNLERFLPYIDNWATCDCLRPKCFKKNTDCLIDYVIKWILDDRTYIKRFGIGMLLSYYLDDEFYKSYLNIVSQIRSDEYYVNMMKAWYFTTALTKQYDSAIEYLTLNKLDKWTHNKTIQKAVESYRIPESQKAFLKTLKR